VKEGTLPRTRWPEDRHDLAGLNAKVDAPEHIQGAPGAREAPAKVSAH